MSSYIVGNNSYKNIKLLSYLLVKEVIGENYYQYQKEYHNKEELKDFIDTGVYNLYKTNVASVAIQYGDKIRFATDNYYEKFRNEVLKCEYKENFPLSRNLVISLVCAFDNINYQIEMEYVKDFMNYIKLLALDYLKRNITKDIEEQVYSKNIKRESVGYYAWGLDDLEITAPQILEF
jgi:hypothetical protein